MLTPEEEQQVRNMFESIGLAKPTDELSAYDSLRSRVDNMVSHIRPEDPANPRLKLQISSKINIENHFEQELCITNHPSDKSKIPISAPLEKIISVGEGDPGIDYFIVHESGKQLAVKAFDVFSSLKKVMKTIKGIHKVSKRDLEIYGFDAYGIYQGEEGKRVGFSIPVIRLFETGAPPSLHDHLVNSVSWDPAEYLSNLGIIPYNIKQNNQA